MTKHCFLFLCLATMAIGAQAQCLSGDCKNGEGVYDYGYATYSGAFKDGEPHGQGTMDYGGDRYVGGFANGKEEGKGLLYKGNTRTEVTYRAGVVQTRSQPVVIGGNPKQYANANCSGNCENGQGTYRFPSGNVYTGMFSNGQFHGQGKMKFASGNVLDGEFEKHVPKRGTFTYADGTVFTGSFNTDGTPATGSYNSPASGGIVEVAAGTITKVSNPRQGSIRAAQPQYTTEKCSYCTGKGFNKSTKTSHSTIGGIGRVGSTGYVDWDYPPQTLTHTSTSYDVCSKCGGSGKMEVLKKK